MTEALLIRRIMSYRDIRNILQSPSRHTFLQGWVHRPRSLRLPRPRRLLPNIVQSRRSLRCLGLNEALVDAHFVVCSRQHGDGELTKVTHVTVVA